VEEKMKFVKNLLSFLIYGFVFWLPIGVVIIVIGFLFGNLESFGKNLINDFYPDINIYPGIVTGTCLAIFILTGLILKKTRLNKIMSKIPFVGMFFGEGQVITFEKLSKLEPCIFLFSPTSISYGWILSEEKINTCGQENGLCLVNIYYPNVPTIITGQIYASRKECVIRLGNSSKEIIDLLLYASKTPPYIKYLPWPEETEEVFQKRAKIFGLNISTG
jgi:uncharacterized membrane protein